MDSQAAEEARDNGYNEGFNAGLKAKARRDRYFRLAFWLSMAIFWAVIIGTALYVASLDCTDIIKCVSNLPMWNTTFTNSTG